MIAMACEGLVSRSDGGTERHGTPTEGTVVATYRGAGPFTYNVCPQHRAQVEASLGFAGFTVIGGVLC